MGSDDLDAGLGFALVAYAIALAVWIFAALLGVGAQYLGLRHKARLVAKTLLDAPEGTKRIEAKGAIAQRLVERALAEELAKRSAKGGA